MWGRPQGLKWWSPGSQGAVQHGTCLSEHFGIQESPRKGSPLKNPRGRHAGLGPGALCAQLRVKALDARREFPPCFHSSLCTHSSSSLLHCRLITGVTVVFVSFRKPKGWISVSRPNLVGSCHIRSCHSVNRHSWLALSSGIHLEQQILIYWELCANVYLSTSRLYIC